MSTETNSLVGTRYQGKSRDIAAQEEELRLLMERAAEQAGDQGVDDPGILEIDAEDATFKKRYGDLRRYSQKEMKKLRDELEAAKNAAPSAPVVIDVPQDDKELEEWMNKYPDAARFVSSVAEKKAAAVTKQLENDLAAIRKREGEIARREAEVELKKMHPDLDDIRSSDEFYDWIEEQPKWVVDAVNEVDAKSVGAVLDLYKAQTQRTTPVKESKTQRQLDREAADLSIRRTPHTEPNTRAKVIRESDVRKMSVKEYQVAEPEIMKALAEGRYVHD